MVLSDGNLYLLDADVLNTIGSGPKIKNVTVFCVNENPNTMDPFTVQVMALLTSVSSISLQYVIIFRWI